MAIEDAEFDSMEISISASTLPTATGGGSQPLAAPHLSASSVPIGGGKWHVQAVPSRDIVECRTILRGPHLARSLPQSWSVPLMFQAKSSSSPSPSQLPSPMLPLHQPQGGPCGVLAVLQAEMLRSFYHTEPAGLSANGPFHLAQGIMQVLERVAAPSNRIVLVQQPFHWNEPDWKQVIVSVDGLAESVSHWLPGFMGPNGLLMLVVSALLSHGLERVVASMDVPLPLIAEHDYCAMELVNLLLAGGCYSNVFDGVRETDGLRLGGIPQQLPIGFLSLFEYYGYVEVGKNAKNPLYPLWVVCSESHYTVLYATESWETMKEKEEKGKEPIQLHYYDTLARQEEDIILELSQTGGEGTTKNPASPVALNDRPPLECCLATKWPSVQVKWINSDPLL